MRLRVLVASVLHVEWLARTSTDIPRGDRRVARKRDREMGYGLVEDVFALSVAGDRDLAVRLDPGVFCTASFKVYPCDLSASRLISVEAGGYLKTGWHSRNGKRASVFPRHSSLQSVPADLTPAQSTQSGRDSEKLGARTCQYADKGNGYFGSLCVSLLCRFHDLVLVAPDIGAGYVPLSCRYYSASLKCAQSSSFAGEGIYGQY